MSNATFYLRAEAREWDEMLGGGWQLRRLANMSSVTANIRMPHKALFKSLSHAKSDSIFCTTVSCFAEQVHCTANAPNFQICLRLVII